MYLCNSIKRLCKTIMHKSKLFEFYRVNSCQKILIKRLILLITKYKAAKCVEARSLRYK